jgi:hypothetical protein
MAKFTDCSGREWTLRLTLGHRAGLQALGIDPTNFGTAVATLAQVTGVDAERLVSVCHLLTVEPVTREEYDQGFDAATIEAAGEALADAVADFYLSRRPKAAAAMKQRVREMMAKLDQAMADAVTRSASGTNSPATAG